MFKKKPVDLDTHSLTRAEVEDFRRLLLTAFRDAAKKADSCRNDEGRPYEPYVKYAAVFFNALRNVEQYMQELPAKDIARRDKADTRNTHEATSKSLRL